MQLIVPYDVALILEMLAVEPLVALMDQGFASVEDNSCTARHIFVTSPRVCDVMVRGAHLVEWTTTDWRTDDTDRENIGRWLTGAVCKSTVYFFAAGSQRPVAATERRAVLAG